MPTAPQLQLIAAFGFGVVSSYGFLLCVMCYNDSAAANCQVWTCEVGECGASLCSVECDARNCATLNWAVREDPSGRFPRALPQISRNLS